MLLRAGSIGDSQNKQNQTCKIDREQRLLEGQCPPFRSSCRRDSVLSICTTPVSHRPTHAVEPVVPLFAPFDDFVFLDIAVREKTLRLSATTSLRPIQNVVVHAERSVSDADAAVKDKSKTRSLIPVASFYHSTTSLS